MNRRNLLKAALAAVPALRAGTPVKRSVDGIPDERRQAAYRARLAAAQGRLNGAVSSQAANGDDERYPDRIASFTKTLPHDRLGHVDPAAYVALLRAIESGAPGAFEAIPVGGVIKLVNPQASYTFDLEGPDSHDSRISTPPRFDSDARAVEACELYWQALLRDVPFERYVDHPLVQAACAELSGERSTQDLSRLQASPSTLFRLPFPGALVGPWLSQFLWKEVPYGAIRLVPHVRLATAGIDYLTQYDDWLAVQNGAATQSKHAGAYKYMTTGRDLAAYVQLDFTYQALLTAALVLFGMEGTTDVRRPYKGAPYDAGNPYRGSPSQSGFVTFGVGHILELIPKVASVALRAAWYQKWLVHRSLRPEEYGGRVHNQMTGQAAYPLPATITRSEAIDRVHRRTGTWLLPQAFPEGAPMHPSYPAGHAAVAGASVTVLKAFFDESFPIEEPVVPTDDALRLRPYDRGGVLTVGGELDKLASNISVGRNIAGVHWRSDAIEGLRLGEQVALALLAEEKACFSEPHSRLSLTMFDGTRVDV